VEAETAKEVAGKTYRNPLLRMAQRTDFERVARDPGGAEIQYSSVIPLAGICASGDRRLFAA
jgi:hypothetical protein